MQRTLLLLVFMFASLRLATVKGHEDTQAWFTLEMEVRPDQLANFTSIFQLVSAETHNEPGVLQYDLLVNAKNQTHFNLVQRYVSLAAAKEHMLQPYVVQYMPMLIKMLAVPFKQTDYVFAL